jgi:hypothetical protein
MMPDQPAQHVRQEEADQDPAAMLPRLAFVHVPKTGGTSVTSALQRAYGAQTLPAMTTLDYPCYADDVLARYRFYRGHAYRRDYARLPPDTRFMTVLRDPVNRALSTYAYYRSITATHIEDRFIAEAVELARTQSAVEFLYSDSPFVIEHLRLGQMRQFLSGPTLAGIGHRQFVSRAQRRTALAEFIGELERFEFVFTCEALSICFPLVAASLGLPANCRVLDRENATPPVDQVDRVDLRRALVDINAAEFEAYAYVQDRQWRFLSDAVRFAADAPPPVADSKAGHSA